MSQGAIFPAPSAGGKPRDYGWEFEDNWRVALKIKNGTADSSTPAQAVGPELSREALDRNLAAGVEEPAALYFYTRTENYNPDDPREVDFNGWYGPAPASGDGCWGATGWYKAMPEQAVVEVMPDGVLLGCAWRGDADGCRTALAHRADPNFRSGSTSVLSAAVQGRSLEVVEVLTSARLNPDQGFDVGRLVPPLVETGERALLERLLSFLRPPEDRWSRLLGLSAHTAIAELLEAHGASVEAAIAAGHLPLREMLSIDHRRPRPGRLDQAGEMVRWLVSRGADVNAVPDNGDTALNMALWYWEVSAIRALLAHGADPYLVHDERCAFDIAAQKGQQEALQALVAEWWTAGPGLPAAVEPVKNTEAPEGGPAEEPEAAAGQVTEESPRSRPFFAWLRGR